AEPRDSRQYLICASRSSSFETTRRSRLASNLAITSRGTSGLLLLSGLSSQVLTNSSSETTLGFGYVHHVLPPMPMAHSTAATTQRRNSPRVTFIAAPLPPPPLCCARSYYASLGGGLFQY